MPEARKLDAGKPRMDLIPPEELLELGGTFGIGAVKYGDDNWKEGDGLDWNRLYAATQRHLALFWSGEDYDQENGHPHLMAAAFGCFTLRWLSKHRKHRDPRGAAEATWLPKGWVQVPPDRMFPEGDHGEHCSFSFEGEACMRMPGHGGDHVLANGDQIVVRPGEAPERPSAGLNAEAEARLPLRILMGQRGLTKLARFVGHLEDCQGFRGDPCTCGLAATIKELEKA